MTSLWNAVELSNPKIRTFSVSLWNTTELLAAKILAISGTNSTRKILASVIYTKQTQHTSLKANTQYKKIMIRRYTDKYAEDFKRQLYDQGG